MTRQPTIRFNAEMAAALLAGRKTATWRLMKPQPIVLPIIGEACLEPPHRPGDRLLVKEPWRVHWTQDRYTDSDAKMILAKANISDSFANFDQEGRLRSAATMPLSIARQAITVLMVEPRRLLSITEAEAREDGFGFEHDFTCGNAGAPVIPTPAYISFRRAIREIYKLPIVSNPWGWRLTWDKVERIDRP